MPLEARPCSDANTVNCLRDAPAVPPQTTRDPRTTRLSPMYATHFKLNGRLFAPGIAQDDAWFVDERDADAGLPAAVALSAPDSVLVLVGPPGVGKTAYAAQALRASAGPAGAPPPATASRARQPGAVRRGFGLRSRGRGAAVIRHGRNHCVRAPARLGERVCRPPSAPNTLAAGTGSRRDPRDL